MSRIGAYAGQYKDLVELLHFVEQRTTEVLGLRRLKIFVTGEEATVNEPWINTILHQSKQSQWLPVEDAPLLLDQGYKIAYPLRREEKVAGLLAVDAASGSLTTDARSVIARTSDSLSGDAAA